MAQPTPDNQANRKTIIGDRPTWLVIGLLLIAHLVVGIDTGRKHTVTLDEYLHLPCGLLSLEHGRFDFDTASPPLVRMWAALPLLATDAVAPNVEEPTDGWGYGDRFVAENPEHYDRWIAIARAMVVILSTIAGLVLALWSKELFGNMAAIVTTLLWTTNPTVIAHAAIVTTDLGATSFFVITIYLLWRYASRPTWSRAIWFGLFIGLAQLTKFTAVLLVPICLTLWFIRRVGAGRKEDVSSGDESPLAVAPISFKQCAAQWVVLIALSGVVLNAGFLFRGSFSSLDSYNFRSESMKKITQLLSPIASWPMPLPREYLVGLDEQRAVIAGDHASYLDGQWTLEGFRHYHVMAAWYKLPHAHQLLGLLAVVCLLFPAGKNRMWRAQLFILLPAVLLFAIASKIHIQLGIRYILPTFPFWTLFVGQVGRWFDRSQYRWRTVAIGVLMIGTLAGLRYHPHHIAYFNELAGGPENGGQHLVDSNIDWGQDLHRLRDYLKQNNIAQIGLAYFGMMPPEALGISYQLPPAGVPQPGRYAVSVSLVHGRPHTIRDGNGNSHGSDIGEFSYFQFFEPKARLGYSIYYYELSPFDVARWQAAYQQMMQQQQR